MTARTGVLALIVAAASLLVVSALVPDVPPVGFRGDGDHYVAMAAHPLDPVSESPYAQRLGVPLLVAALPIGVDSGFLIVTVVSLLAAAVLVALIARELGLAPTAQAAAALLTAGSYIAVHGLYIPYYVDPPTLALVALALWLALRRQWLPFAIALVGGVLVKEVAATLIVVPYLLDARRRSRLDVRAVARAAIVAAPALAAFAAVHVLAPVAPTAESDVRLSFVEMGILSRGLVTSIANPVLALFGIAAVLWPLGALRGPAEFRRLHVWAALALPILAFGHMERTLGILVPLAIPAALLALRGARPALVAAFALGSWWVTAVAGALTVGPGAASVTEKGALVAPGLVVAVGAAAAHLLRPRSDVAALPQRSP